MLNEPSVNVELENSMSRNLKGGLTTNATQNGCGESLYEDSKEGSVMDHHHQHNTSISQQKQEQKPL